MIKTGFRLLAVLLLLGLATFAAAQETVPSVTIKGLLRLEETPLLSTLKTVAGSAYDEANLRDDIKALYDTGNFDTVAASLESDGSVSFIVIEKPALHDWSLEGDDQIKEEDVEKELPLKTGELIKRGMVEQSEEILRRKYFEKGYYLCRITPEIKKIEDGKNRADLVFRVKRGEKVQVRKINLPGVSPEDEKALRDGMLLPEEGFWSWLTTSASFSKEQLDRDVEWINYYYADQGYAEARVDKPVVELTPDMRYVRVDIPITPGRLYDIGVVSFSGDSQFEEAKLREAAALKTGERFSSKNLREAMWRLEELHTDEGYAFARARPQVELDREKLLVKVNFAIEKGDRYTIGRIDVLGNTISRDRVLRREFEIAEGEIYKGSAIKDAQKRINRLGFFESVDMDLRRRPGTSLIDVEVKVKEQPTGTISAGGGYSTVDGIYGMINLSQRNLFGYGYQLSLNGMFGVENENYTLSFSNPRVYDSKVYAGLDLYKNYKEYSEFIRKSYGFSLKTGLSFNDEWSSRISYSLDNSEVYDVCTQSEYDAGTCTDPASLSVQEQEGTIITSSVTPSITYDTRDNYWEATKGVNVKLAAELAGGPMGFDSDYLKTNLDAKKYWPGPFDSVFTVEGHGAHIKSLSDEEVPIYERFALGGMYTIRGFGYRSIGPRDEATGEVLGGDKYVQFNAECLYPLVKEAKLKLVFFVDAGNVWDIGEDFFASRLRMSTGAGFRWFSPMGPLRLEYGRIIDGMEGSGDSRWDFSIGGFF